MTEPRRSLLRAASPLIMARAASAAFTFFIPVVLARRLPLPEYGTYKQFFLVASTCTLAFQLGMTASLYYFVPKDPVQRCRYIVQALLLLLAVGVASAFTILGFIGELAFRFDNPALEGLALPLALFAGLALGATPLEIALTSCGKTGWAGAAYVLSDIARTAALLGPIGAGLGLTGIAWGAVLFAAARLAWAWGLALSGRLGRPLPPTRGALRTQLAYALPLGAAVLLAVGQAQLPQYAVAALTDARTYAVFAVGALQLPFTDLLYTPIAEVMMVRLAERPREAAAPIFREAVSRLVVFFFPMAALAWGTARVLIPTLYTPVYLAAIPIFAIAAAEIVLSSFPVDGLLRALGATRVVLLVNALRFVVTLVLVPSLLILFGLPGAMAGYVVSQYLAKSLLLMGAARQLRISAWDLVPARNVATWAACAAAMFSSLAALRELGPFRGIPFLCACIVVAGGLWAVALVMTGELLRKPRLTSKEVNVG